MSESEDAFSHQRLMDKARLNRRKSNSGCGIWGICEDEGIILMQ